jgi:ubiquinone/menaquinone biosynthesis C-methylase UbiE
VDASFDAVICECAFCTFPDKSAAAREFARVLIMVGLKKVDLPGVDFAKAKELLNASLEAIHAGQLGYAILTASRQETRFRG